ncbi:phage protein [Clostridium ljungdahlii]|uniref:phage protein n=1 Tax=Clostridium ljungdahlii TaxID=1538 RepID=UPI003868A075
MSIEEDVWRFLRSKNFSEKSTAAVMGNIYGESSFNPSEIESGSGDGFGLIQWSFERRTQLEAYGTDLTHQLNFLWAELTGDTGNTGAESQWTNVSGYLSHDNFMSGNGSINDLTAAMCFCFERPGVPRLSTRQEYAQKYYNQFTGTAGTPSADSQQSISIPSTNYQVVANSQKEGQILYGRRYRITVSDEKGNGFDVSQLRCTFSIVKTILMEPNTSEITIYNLNSQTENNIELYGTRVTVEAGYEGSQYGTIFDGDILQTIRDKEDSATYRLTIIALDSDRAVNFDIANYSIARSQTARSIVDHIVNKAQYPVSLGSISESLNNSPKLTRGKVFFGKSSDYLNQIAESNGCKYYTEDGKVNLVKLDEMPKGEIFELSPSSGLIGTPEQSDYGITGQCLLNPQIKVNSLIHIDNSLIRAKKISITGNSTVPTMGGSSTNSTRQKIIDKAKEIVQKHQEGKAVYVLGGRGTNSQGQEMYDCSIFAETCYAAAGITMSAPSSSQYSKCANGGLISSDMNRLKNEGKPGDLLFEGSGGSEHVEIYDGNGGNYAAHTANRPIPEQIRHDNNITSPYMTSWGRPKELMDADNGNPPSASGTNTTDSNTTQTPVYRSLDKDGIFRVLKVTMSGDTRGDEWYTSFTAIDQLGGIIPITAI